MLQEESNIYAEVILPLAVKTNYSYKVPDELKDNVIFGVRVEVPLRNKLYAGIVASVSDVAPDTTFKLRNIRSVLDEKAIIDTRQLKLWKWMAKYYCCTIGEVMNMVLPSGLKLNSETKLKVAEDYQVKIDQLPEKEFLLAEAIAIQKEISIETAREILQQKTVIPYIRALIDKRVIDVEEELISKYKVKYEDFVCITQEPTETFRQEAYEQCDRSEKQQRVLDSYFELYPEDAWIPKLMLNHIASTDSSVIKALIKKGIFKLEKREVTRLKEYNGDVTAAPPLSEDQKVAVSEINQLNKQVDHILLFGVTGSGKTRVYIEIIEQVLAEGKQVLYLLPEIALTTQLVRRLQKVFGDKISLYHSKLNNNARVELYHAAAEGKPIFMGARSSLFLPFKDLGLIIVDEEHDPSFKQNDPAPRYNARDTAIFLSRIYNAKVILGSATPSLESFVNAIEGKYGLVKMLKRHGKSTLPKIELVDLRKSYKAKEMQSHFSKELIDGIVTALSKKEQVLLFQNRRGYAHTLRCPNCEWHVECPNCDVSMTVHQYFHELRCHYCGSRSKLYDSCPECGNGKLTKLGFGTEKIEVELQRLMPSARIARLDFDTAKTKAAYDRILTDFDLHKVDILVGTQMITKGLDFDNISLVGVLLADKSLFFPDFRANERSIQLFTQVAGRAGRREKKGKVVLQTFTPDHPVITETINHDIKGFYDRELKERKDFLYPPFYRLINLTLKHKDPKVLNAGAKELAKLLKEKLGRRVLGPTPPGISRIRGLFIEQIMIKLEKDTKTIAQIKLILQHCIAYVKQHKSFKSIRTIIDVDP